MSDRMFGNDPDVMILRNQKNKLNLEERYTLCVLNNILGALVFSSDNVAEYGKDEHLLYAATFPKVIASVQSVIEFRPNVFVIRFQTQGRDYTTFANLCSDDQKVYLPPSSDKTHLLFSTDNEMHMTPRFSLSSWFSKADPLFYHPSSSVYIRAHETKTMMHIPPPKDGQALFMGSTSHIVPGAEVDAFTTDATKDIQLKFNAQNTREHTTYIGIGNYLSTEKTAPTQAPTCTINGVQPSFEWIPVHGTGEGRPASHVHVAVVKDGEQQQ